MELRPLPRRRLTGSAGILAGIFFALAGAGEFLPEMSGHVSPERR